MTTIPSRPNNPPGRDALGRAAGNGADWHAVDIRGIQHPYEYSRLLLALASTIIVFGAMVLWIFIVLPELAIPFFTPIIVFLLTAAAAIWFLILVHRARLLGSAVLVTTETLPLLAETVEIVRDSLDYRRRVDVYVAEKASSPVTMWNYMGTRVILFEGGLIGDLQDDAKRPQLVFLLGSMFGQLKARHRHFTLIVAWLEGQENLKFLNLFLAPYFRATTYSGDQIGAACCNDVPAAAAMMNRLLVGKELSPSLAVSGVLDQAARVRTRWLPRFAQLNMNEPHLTNRYLNLMAFAARTSPAAAQAYFDTLDTPARQRLMHVIETSPHRRKSGTSRKTPQGVMAAIVTVAALVITGFVAAQARTVLITPENSVVVEPEEPTQPVSPEPSPPTAAEKLLSHLPSSFAGRCQEEREQDPVQAKGLVTELSCSSADGGPDSAYFLQYESVQALDASFSYLTSGIPTSTSTCRATFPGRGNLTQGSVTTGRYGCFESGAGENLYLWTDLGLGIMCVAVDASMSFGELRTWRITNSQLR